MTLTRPSELGDEGLMQRVRLDDTDAFAELYERYHGRAFVAARQICESTERAEEAVQDAFLSLWTTRGGYDPSRGGIQTWIFALIRNRSIDIYRKNRRRDSLRASDATLEAIPALESVEDGAVQQDEGEHLRTSLQRLPLPQREVIVLAYFGGLSHVEIAGRLALPVGTVKGRMRLGLNKARAEINRANEVEPGLPIS